VESTPYLSLILPAYNEAGSIARTLGEAQAYLARQGWAYEILVVADGADGTRELVLEMAARDARLRVFGGEQRGGKGRAIRLGVSHARGQVIGFTDADNKTPIEELERVLPWLAEGHDLVIGSRGRQGTQIENPAPLHRRLGSKLFGLAMHSLIGLWDICDTQCGFKFFRCDVARDLFARQRIDGYMFDVEVLYLAQQSGYRIKEVGVRWRDDGDTRLQLIAGNWRNMIDLFRIRLGKPAKAMPKPAQRQEKPQLPMAA
jgi:dolichyl-phosphate beta-glucosyltransferase